MTELVKEIKSMLQNIIHQNKKYAQGLKFENDFTNKEKDNFLKVDNEEAAVLEEEIAAAILEDKKIDFLKPCYEEHNLLQIPAEIENERQEKATDYLKFASEYFVEDFKAPENIDKEKLANVISSTKEIINNDLVVDIKPTLEKWFINDEFVDCGLNTYDKSEAFINDLTERKFLLLKLPIMKLKKKWKLILFSLHPI